MSGLSFGHWIKSQTTNCWLKLSTLSPTSAAWLAGAVVASWYVLVPLLTGTSYIGLDLTLTDLGNLCEARNWLFHGLPKGLSPGISEHLGGGQPLFADPHVALLYPPRFISLLFSTRWAAVFQVAFHLGLGSAGIGMILKRLKISVSNLIAVAVADGWMGVAVDYLTHTTYLVDLTWLPWFFYFLSEILNPKNDEKKLYRAALGAGASFLGLLLGGEPQATLWCFLVTLVGGLALILLPGLRERFGSQAPRRLGKKPAYRKNVLALALVGVGFALISLLQWLPTLEEVKITVRVLGYTEALGLIYSFDLAGWLSSLISGFTDPTLSTAYLFRVFFSSDDPSAVWIQNYYLGWMLVVFALCSFGDRRARVVGVLTTVALIFSLGRQTPIYPYLFKHLSILSHLRYPAKHVVVFDIGLVLLAAIGLERLTEKNTARPLVAYSLAAMVFPTFGYFWLKTHGADFDKTVWDYVQVNNAYLVRGDSPSVFFMDGIVRSLLPLVLALVSCLMIKKWATLLRALLLLDLLIANFVSLPITHEGYEPTQPTILQQFRSAEEKVKPSSELSSRPAQEQEIYCISRALRPYVPLDRDGNGGVPGLIFAFQKFISAPQLNACAQERLVPAYSPLTNRVSAALRDRVFDDNINTLRATGCTVVGDFALRRPSHVDGAQALPVLFHYDGQEDQFFAYRLSNPIPPIAVVQNPFWELDLSHFLLSARQIHTPATLIQAVGLSPNERETFPLPDGKGTEVKTYAHPRPDRFEFELQGQGGGVVMIRHPYALGWRAFQAGRELHVERDLGQFLGVVVEQPSLGPVTVEYFIPKLREGIFSAILGIFLIAWGRRRFLRAWA